MRHAILALAALAALALPVTAAAPAPAAQRPAGGEVHPVKHVYRLGEKIAIAWSGVEASGDLQFWMEPAGTPLKGYPHGSYHSDDESSGRYALESPGSGRWEVHWSILGEAGVHRGGRFRVRPPRAKHVARGHYGCYTTTTMGLTRSSLQWIEIRRGNRYRALGRSGRFRYRRATATLRMTSGPLKRRVAQFRPDRRPTTIIFRRRSNEVRGKPRIDVSDTYCYRGQQ